MGLRKALDLDLVQDCLVPGRAGRVIGPPVEKRVDNDRFWHRGSTVLVVAQVRVPTERVRVDGWPPSDLTVDGLSIRVQQQLVRVAALAGGRVVGAVRSITVALPGQHLGQIGVPAVSGCFRHRDPGFPLVAEQAELDALGHLGKDREVGPGAVVAGAQRVR